MISSRTRRPVLVASSSPPTATCVSTATPTAGPRRNNASIGATPSTVWSTCQDAHRLALMNLMLHGLDSDPDAAGIRYGDTLGQEGEALCKQGATLILTNPPFGTKKGGGAPLHARTSPSPPATSSSAFCSTSTAVSRPAAALPWCSPTTCCSRAIRAGRSVPI